MRFSVNLFTPVQDGATPIVAVDLNPQITDLRWTLAINGGFQGLEVGMQATGRVPVVGYLPQPLDIPPFAHVEVVAGSRIVWEGRVVEMTDAPEGVLGFVAEGYGFSGLTDNWSRSTSTADVTSGEALVAILRDCAPWIRVGAGDRWNDPGVVHGNGLSEFYKLTPADVVAQITRQGTTSGELVDFAVWEGRTANLTVRRQPAYERYRVPFDETVGRRRNYRGTYGAITVEYGSSSGTLTDEAEDTTFMTRFLTMRRALVTAGDITADSAVIYRDTQLAFRSRPEVAYTLERDATRGLERRIGTPTPYYIVRPGEWVNVADDDWQVIVAASVDATGERATYEVGAFSPILPKNYGASDRIAIRNLRNNIHPHGGRTR